MYMGESSKIQKSLSSEIQILKQLICPIFVPIKFKIKWIIVLRNQIIG